MSSNKGQSSGRANRRFDKYKLTTNLGNKINVARNKAKNKNE